MCRYSSCLKLVVYFSSGRRHTGSTGDSFLGALREPCQCLMHGSDRRSNQSRCFSDIVYWINTE